MTGIAFIGVGNMGAIAAARLTVSGLVLARWLNAVTETPSTANERVSPAASASGPRRLFRNAAAITTGSSGGTHGLMRVSVARRLVSIRRTISRIGNGSLRELR